MDDDFAAAIAELNRITFDLDTSGPRVTADMVKITKAYAGKIEGNAKAIVAVDTGATRNSIGVDYESDAAGDGYSIEATIGAQTSYAPYLEFGTSRMAPRAFLGPSLDRYSGSYTDALAAAAIPNGWLER